MLTSESFVDESSSSATSESAQTSDFEHEVEEFDESFSDGDGGRHREVVLSGTYSGGNDVIVLWDLEVTSHVQNRSVSVSCAHFEVTSHVQTGSVSVPCALKFARTKIARSKRCAH